ncbi:MAG: hypothetical protein GY847_01355 [Proteobacteria bacterium]|nr:hypothetical protein [Pseudomonadota bacterium]
MPLSVVFEMYRGDQETFLFTVREGGALKDLSGITPHFVGKTSFAAGATSYLFDKSCTVTAVGKCNAVLTSSDTDQEVESGVCELVLVTDVGGAQKTYDQWGLAIKKDIYRG